ncbi:MAG TPA: hypothetical protein DCL21_06995 [Alphaproteobacteria bacterium]|nr:hypothetical protein [Alphaproteobacteria bacterium]
MHSIFSLRNLTVDFAMLNGALAKLAKVLAFLIVYSYVGSYIVGIVAIAFKGSSLELITYCTAVSLLLNILIFSLLFLFIFMMYMKKEEFESKLAALKPEYLDFLSGQPQSIDVCKEQYSKEEDYKKDLFMLNVLAEKKLVKRIFSDEESHSFEVDLQAFNLLHMNSKKTTKAKA